jgi:hypothetical protein
MRLPIWAAVLMFVPLVAVWTLAVLVVGWWLAALIFVPSIGIPILALWRSADRRSASSR